MRIQGDLCMAFNGEVFPVYSAQFARLGLELYTEMT